jgi:hypothetical protein
MPERVVRIWPGCVRYGEGKQMLDVMFLATIIVFFGLSLGYAAVCDRL